MIPRSPGKSQLASDGRARLQSGRRQQGNQPALAAEVRIAGARKDASSSAAPLRIRTATPIHKLASNTKKPAGKSAKPKAAREKRVDLLFEIGCEEIPAGMLPKAEEELRANLTKLLTTENFVDGVTVETFSAPRRLVASVRGLLAKQADVTSEVTGPPKSVAYDAVGAPTRAAVSFAEKQGVTLQDVYTIPTPKGEYLAAKTIKRGRTAAQILNELLPRAIHDLTWPRSMTWTGLDGARFIRPIRWIVGLLDGQPLQFSYGGVVAGNKTRGHRFLGSAEIPVRDFADYEKRLKANAVIVRPAARAEKIERELAAHAKKSGLKIHEDAHLRKMVTYLNEFPSVIEGNFDPAFLALPDEILVTVMRDHQKYFALEKRNGDLAPHFLAVINLASDPKGVVRAGHEKVLRARFADAQFFWHADQKCRLADYLPKLDRITYESKLGSYLNKVERVRFLARWLAEGWFNRGIAQAHVLDADRAAELSKCDLATEMVRELTELQGIVGGLYARAQGESDEIADAVYDQYRPVGLEDEIPRNLTGCAVAIADKLDSILGCFAAGKIPTGSSDPFALRRAALGIVKILVEKSLPLSLSGALSAAQQALAKNPPHVAVSVEQKAQAYQFLIERAKFFFKEKFGFAYDELNAVFATAFAPSATGQGSDQAAAPDIDLVDAEKRLIALRKVRKSKNFEPLAISFKRIRKILEKANFNPATAVAGTPELFENEAEKELHHAVRDAATKVQADKRAGRYLEALETIAGLRKSIDRFFEEVMVMAEDERIRNNRLALLAQVLREFTTVADFSELAAE
jgi:glycyl-tRNA synthetase beta chain